MYALPSSRVVQWAGNVGISGGIPARSQVYTTLSSTGGDQYSAIQTAINNCPAGKIVLLADGNFYTSKKITVKPGITLRGSGINATYLYGMAGFADAYVVGFNNSPYYGTACTLTYVNLLKGATEINTSVAHGLKAGDVILIDQIGDATGDPKITNVGSNGTATWLGRDSGTRCIGQLNRVKSVPTFKSIELEIPLYWNYSTTRTAQVCKVSGMTKLSGIEDMTVDNLTSGGSSQANDGATISMYGTDSCWLLRVRGVGSWTSMVRMKRSFRDIIRHCVFRDGVPMTPYNGSQYNTSRAYGIHMYPSSACLIEDNQFLNLTMPVCMNGVCSGNVFAYNYSDEQRYAPSATWQVDHIRFHGGHPVMNLFEGNIGVGCIKADNTWGSSSHNTFFRNRNTLEQDRPSSAWNFAIYDLADYFNIVGNVIGDGWETALKVAINSTSKAIYAHSTSNNLKHANWDSVTDGVVYNGSDDQVLPDSLYLTAKPEWWGSGYWPAIGPDVEPMYPAATGTIGEGTPWSGLSPGAVAREGRTEASFIMVF